MRSGIWVFWRSDSMLAGVSTTLVTLTPLITNRVLLPSNTPTTWLHAPAFTLYCGRLALLTVPT